MQFCMPQAQPQCTAHIVIIGSYNQIHLWYVITNTFLIKILK